MPMKSSPPHHPCTITLSILIRNRSMNRDGTDDRLIHSADHGAYQVAR